VSKVEQRHAAVRGLVASSGRSTADVLRAVEGSWGESAFERAELRQRLAANPPPTATERAAQQAARTAASVAANDMQAERDAQAVAVFRNYQAVRDKNPFAAATLRRDYGNDMIERGRELDENPELPPEPPKAA
jgi:hypothetical protein